MSRLMARHSQSTSQRPTGPKSKIMTSLLQDQMIMSSVELVVLLPISIVMGALPVALATGPGLCSASIMIHGLMTLTGLADVYQIISILEILKMSSQWASMEELTFQTPRCSIKISILPPISSEALWSTMWT